MLPPVVLRFDAYGEYERATSIVDKLNRANPKSPLKLDLVSWNIDDEGNLIPDKGVYCELETRSQARLIHFIDELRAADAIADKLKRELKLSYTPTNQKPQEAEDPVLFQLTHFFSDPGDSRD